ncbi:response regulator [Desulfohalovibrio reitneri]|uniref:response regulator n=1 Tax=Desulfohalovibrio reitneri TaxID=1307759 RepID=UPI0004A6E0E9|nr:response regulator [Desulfohalovibrio reitneri]
MGNGGQKPKQYDEIVRDFVEEDRGTFIVVSNDQTFLKVFRGTMYKTLALPQGCVEAFAEKARAQKQVKAALAAGNKPLVIIERELEGVLSVEFVSYLRNDYPHLPIIVLTGEIERDGLVLLHEMGVNNFVTKPVSANVMIEKMANTIKPPSRLGELVEAGKRFNAKHDFDKALTVADKVLSLKQDSPAGLMLRGDALKGLGKRQEALAAYEGARRGASMYLEPIKKLVQFYKEEEDLDMQLKYLEELDRLSPLNVDRKVDIGGISLKRGDTDKARGMFDSAKKLATRQAFSKVSTMLKQIAESCMDADPEMAEEYLRQSLETKGDMLDKSDLETFNTLGIVLRRQGRWKDALSEYEKARKVAPEDENLHYNMAMAYVDGKEFDNASKELNKAVKLNPEFGYRSATACFNIGYIYSMAGHDHLAKERLNAALKLDPDHAKAKKLLDKLS